MTLLELFEPIFVYICRLNRSARKGDWSEYDKVRAEVQAIFEGMRQTAEKEPGLRDQYEKMELPVIFFVDSMIAESNLGYATRWHENRLAYERNELAGDERFWVMLDQTLEDDSEEATARLAVYYACIGLGFVGDYVGAPEEVRTKMARCAARLGDAVDTDQAARICPDAYEHVDTRDLARRPTVSLLRIGITLAVLLLLVFLAQVYLFDRATGRLINALDSIAAHRDVIPGSDARPPVPTKETPKGD